MPESLKNTLNGLYARRNAINEEIKRLEKIIGRKSTREKSKLEILQIFKNSGGIATRKVILSQYKGKSLDVYLSELKSDGFLVQVGRGKYTTKDLTGYAKCCNLGKINNFGGI